MPRRPAQREEDPFESVHSWDDGYEYIHPGHDASPGADVRRDPYMSPPPSASHPRRSSPHGPNLPRPPIGRDQDHNPDPEDEDIPGWHRYPSPPSAADEHAHARAHARPRQGRREADDSGVRFDRRDDDYRRRRRDADAPGRDNRPPLNTYETMPSPRPRRGGAGADPDERAPPRGRSPSPYPYPRRRATAPRGGNIDDDHHHHNDRAEPRGPPRRRRHSPVSSRSPPPPPPSRAATAAAAGGAAGAAAASRKDKGGGSDRPPLVRSKTTSGKPPLSRFSSIYSNPRWQKAAAAALQAGSMAVLDAHGKPGGWRGEKGARVATAALGAAAVDALRGGGKDDRGRGREREKERERERPRDRDRDRRDRDSDKRDRDKDRDRDRDRDRDVRRKRRDSRSRERERERDRDRDRDREKRKAPPPSSRGRRTDIEELGGAIGGFLADQFANRKKN